MLFVFNFFFKYILMIINNNIKNKIWKYRLEQIMAI